MGVQVEYCVVPLEKGGTAHIDTKMTTLYVEGEGGNGVRSPINLSTHVYWNLAGHLKRSVEGHTLKMEADRYLPMDNTKVRRVRVQT